VPFDSLVLGPHTAQPFGTEAVQEQRHRTMQHNRKLKQPSPKPVERPVESDHICVLLTDGSLWGPFKSREDAMYWTVSQDLTGYSTYDLRDPGAFQSYRPPSVK
jgi:hypothetical protein